MPNTANMSSDANIASKRHFTRADVVAKCLAVYGTENPPPYQQLHVLEVRLLTEVPQPIWRAELECGHGTPTCYKFTSILAEYGPAAPRLGFFIDEETLPEGAATVEEEDTLIRDVRARRVAEWKMKAANE